MLVGKDNATCPAIPGHVYRKLLLLLLFGFLFFDRRNDYGDTTRFSWSAFWSRRSRWARCRGRDRHDRRARGRRRRGRWHRLNYGFLCPLCPLASVQSDRSRNDCSGHQPASHCRSFLLWLCRIAEHDLYQPAAICFFEQHRRASFIGQPMTSTRILSIGSPPSAAAPSAPWSSVFTR